MISAIMETNINYYKRELSHKDDFKPKKQNSNKEEIKFSEVLKNINKNK